MNTVYSTIAEDGTLRMALHPMEQAPEAFFPDDKKTRPKIRFSFRVIWWWGRVYSWAASCRGQSYICRPLLFSSIDEALAWLIEDEQ